MHMLILEIVIMEIYFPMRLQLEDAWILIDSMTMAHVGPHQLIGRKHFNKIGVYPQLYKNKIIMDPRKNFAKFTI